MSDKLEREHLVAVRAIAGALSAFHSNAERRFVMARALGAADVDCKDLRSCCPDAASPDCCSARMAKNCDCVWCEFARGKERKP